MATVYLHIGTPKTGTSAIQHFLAENREVLTKYGYCLPDLYFGFGTPFLERNGHVLIHRYRRETVEESRKEYREGLDRAFAILEQAAKEYDHIILTEEAIWKDCNSIKDFWKDLMERFRAIGCDVKIVVYLRRQDQIVESLWNQWVKSFFRSTITFREWLDKRKYSYYPMDYYGHLMKIAKHVGKENILIRVYEKSRFEGDEQSIFSDFFQTIGLPLTDEYKRDYISTNNGLKNNFIELKRILNGIPEYRELEDFMGRPVLYASDYAGTMDGGPKNTMFSYQEQLEILKEYEETNRKVAVEFLGREDGILFTEPVKELPMWKWNPDTVTRDMMLIMGEVFIAQEKKRIRQQKSLDALGKEIRSARGRLDAQQKRLDAQKKMIEDQRRQIRSLQAQVDSMYQSSIFRAYRWLQKLIKGKKAK